MDNKQFKGILTLLVSSLIKLIIEEKCISAQDALTLLYSSVLYSKLENEATKLWNLSAKTLCDMLNEELTTGIITYPE